jgi:hypothetical protein
LLGEVDRQPRDGAGARVPNPAAGHDQLASS